MTPRRYELTDFEWSIIAPLLPNKPRGVPRADDRKVLNGIYWRCARVRPGPTFPSRTIARLPAKDSNVARAARGATMSETARQGIGPISSHVRSAMAQVHLVHRAIEDHRKDRLRLLPWRDALGDRR